MNTNAEAVREAFAQLPIREAVPKAKPMRLRVLELPTVTLGQASETRFILVFDRCTGEDGDSVLLDIGDEMAKKCGAQATLAFRREVDLG